MAGPKPYRQNFDRRVKTGEGHDVKWELSLKNLNLLHTWSFVKNYETYCETTSTKWFFKLSLPELRDDGTSTLSVLLRREDTHNLELEACIWIDICDPNENLIYPKQTFTKTGMLPGHTIQETVELLPMPNMSDAIHRLTVVFTTLMICFCHPESD